MQLQKVETWFDPLEMFRQMVKSGAVVTKEPVTIPTDVDSSEPKEAAVNSSSEAMAAISLDEPKSSTAGEGTNAAAADVAENWREEKSVAQEPADKGNRISKSEPKVKGTGPADHLQVTAASDTPQPQPDLSVRGANGTSNTHNVRKEVIPPEEVLESVQTVAEKELDVDLAEEKGKGGVYQSSGCPFLVTTADQNVLNRE